MPRIVVIDDEPVLRLTFRHILEGAGHQVWAAENGRVGLDVCREASPDLVITDMMMPEQEGVETLAILHDEFPSLPVIAMSGGGVMLTAEQQKEWNVHYVVKPLERPRLLGLVDDVLKETTATAQPPGGQWKQPSDGSTTTSPSSDHAPDPSLHYPPQSPGQPCSQ
jgi:DNA-binding NtrC family response regulator